jgi:hypothetical protein
MQEYFDTLPVAVRARLRNSPFNLCPGCLVTKFLSRMPWQRSREQRLLAAIAVMEAEVRKMNEDEVPRPKTTSQPAKDTSTRIKNGRVKKQTARRGDQPRRAKQ